MTPRKILCPIDFSAGSRHALRVATRLANELGAPLVLAHAWFIPPIAIGGEFPLPSDSIQAMVDDAHRGLTDAVTEAKKAGVEKVSSEFLSGPPAERIAELASPGDLIVMGTHGRTGIPRFLLGSVAERVVRHAKCSVLIAREHGEPQPYRHILVPVDFSESSRRALEEAGDLASRTGAVVTLLHVLELPASGLVPEAEQRAVTLLEEWGELVEQKTRTRVWNLVKTGTPAQQVLATAADDPSIDLIVLGSHGRTGMSRLLIGSVAEKVVRHAHRPVLIAR